MSENNYYNYIEEIKDFPKSGISFKDITPLLKDFNAFGRSILEMSFMVEKRNPNKLTIGYWPYDVSEDKDSINDWLDGDFTFNKEYQIYKNINQLKTTFKNYKNPVL